MRRHGWKIYILTIIKMSIRLKQICGKINMVVCPSQFFLHILPICFCPRDTKICNLDPMTLIMRILNRLSMKILKIYVHTCPQSFFLRFFHPLGCYLLPDMRGWAHMKLFHLQLAFLQIHFFLNHQNLLHKTKISKRQMAFQTLVFKRGWDGCLSAFIINVVFIAMVTLLVK